MAISVLGVALLVSSAAYGATADSQGGPGMVCASAAEVVVLRGNGPFVHDMGKWLALHVSFSPPRDGTTIELPQGSVLTRFSDGTSTDDWIAWFPDGGATLHDGSVLPVRGDVASALAGGRFPLGGDLLDVLDPVADLGPTVAGLSQSGYVARALADLLGSLGSPPLVDPRGTTTGRLVLEFAAGRTSTSAVFLVPLTALEHVLGDVQEVDFGQLGKVTLSPDADKAGGGGTAASDPGTARRAVIDSRPAGQQPTWVVPVPGRGETTERIACSLARAKQAIEASGPGWRQVDTDLLCLGGITKMLGVVHDSATDDLIWVGCHVPERAPLTLDDLIVALRAQLVRGAWTAVSIESPPGTDGTGPRKVEYTGGVENTAFGADMLEAYCQLMRIAMGVEPAGVPGLRSASERKLTQDELARTGARQSCEATSRYWIYPGSALDICPHEGLCTLWDLRVSVCTAVLSAQIDGTPVADVSDFRFPPHEEFAQEMTERYDELCAVRPCFSRLRGLLGLASLARGIKELPGAEASIEWWLKDYSVQAIPTPNEVTLK